MSKIKNGGLEQYGAEPAEQQHLGAAGVEDANASHRIITFRGVYPPYRQWRSPHQLNSVPSKGSLFSVCSAVFCQGRSGIISNQYDTKCQCRRYEKLQLKIGKLRMV